MWYYIVLSYLLVAECVALSTIGSGNVTIDWNNVTAISKTATTLQVVVNPQLRRGASMHDGAFASLKLLKADYIRFVPWLPYPKLGVAEIAPPAGKTVCSTIRINQNMYLECYQGVIEDVVFASFGNPGGRCGSFTHGSCKVANAADIVKRFCLGQQRCSVPSSTDVFSDPCPGTEEYLSVEVACSNPQNKTFWDFSVIDPMMEDLMTSTQGHSTIINFSTIPQWMWNTPSPVLVPTDPDQVIWNYEQGDELRDRSFQELGDYFERLVSWYTKGGFTDEFGKYHASGHYYNIPIWEVLNEVEGEHYFSPQYYTKIYDVIVKSIQKVQPKMEFMGMALAGRSLEWMQYFLNSSNHQPGVPIHWMSYHFYSTPISRTDTNGYGVFFSQADGLFESARAIEAIRKKLAPTTKTDIDEIGVILPSDNVLNPQPIPELYWNAAGALYAYIVANLAPLGVDVLGESQLIGYPTQYPSVSMVRFPDGTPNARFWVLYLLHKHFSVGDKIVNVVSPNENVYVAAYSTQGGRRVLLINKTGEKEAVTIAGLASGEIEFVDLTTGYNLPCVALVTSPTIPLTAYAVVVLSIKG